MYRCHLRWLMLFVVNIVLCTVYHLFKCLCLGIGDVHWNRNISIHLWMYLCVRVCVHCVCGFCRFWCQYAHIRINRVSTNDQTNNYINVNCRLSTLCNIIMRQSTSMTDITTFIWRLSNAYVALALAPLFRLHTHEYRSSRISAPLSCN